MKYPRKQIARGVAALALVALSMTGCAQNNAEGGKTSLKFWTFLDPTTPGDPRAEAMQELVDAYNENSKDTTVSIVSYNHAKIDSEMIRAVSSGGGPDIVDVQTIQLPLHVEAGSLLPITDYAQPFLDKAGDDYQFQKDLRSDGEIMSLQWEQRGFVLWYRADLLKEAGLEVPTTLDELRDTGAALGKHTGHTGLAIGFSPDGLGASFMEKFVPLTWGFGGDFVVGGEAQLDSEGSVEALDYLRSLKDSGAFGDEVINMSADDILEGFKAGTIGMAIEGTHRVRSARSAEGIGDNLQTVPIPSGIAGTPLDTPTGGWSLGIGANTKNPDAAWDFIEYYLSPASQTRIALGGSLPVRASALDSPEVQALPNAKELLMWRDYLTEHSRPFPRHPRYGEMSVALARASQQAVFGGVSSSKALKDAVASFNQ